MLTAAQWKSAKALSGGKDRSSDGRIKENEKLETLRLAGQVPL
jgi:hypothetical protein